VDAAPNFQLLFEESPDVLLALLPDAPVFTMVAVTRARLKATNTTLEQTLGHGLFELFPDNPDDPTATGTTNLRASLDRVLATRAADTMAVQKYDIRRTDGTFEPRYWSPKNIPILSSKGKVLYILHRVEDVTELVRASEQGDELKEMNRAMEREVINRSRELSEAIKELRSANDRLGDLDAAKTSFFGNISHEFRTPLTLMLGPIEDALQDTIAPLGPDQKKRIQLAHDNALRLFKLVNALLDFSKLEASRLQAHFAPLDISGFTAELSGMFQSAADKLGLKLIVDCPKTSEPVWVDRDMWEKVVPNLISNALKFTFVGAIAVRLREEPARIILEVSDTGIGIPETELSRLFQRFHRIAVTKGRTHEGSGIGLSLVRELAELHGGKVSVETAVGKGTTFRVSIPKGYAHLPIAAVAHTPVNPHIGRDAAAHAAEAKRWSTEPLSASITGKADSQGEGAAKKHVLVVDDNADLRAYLAALLSPLYEVITASDGQEALKVMRILTPDIVLSDVMMPRLDGFGLVRAIRSNPETASLPVILLSARAGEESAIDGLNAGSDDYLIKPFSARELLARVRTHLQLASLRRAWIAELERANHELDAFSYSVSHDLRAPLRAIEGYARALIDDCLPQLDLRGRKYVDSICDGAKRMTTLVDALLSLAQIRRTPVRSELVDVSSLARMTVADLRLAEPNRSVTVDIEDGLVARGDRILIQVALVNLLGNAWKFTSMTTHPRIEVGRKRDADAAFFVRDNGPGFDMSNADRLFSPFHRLHHDTEFAGTGIGLATVHRVVARHGGEIWAEATVGKGATFFFSLPDQAN
jgi:signal transduction histidine kinase